MDPVSSENDALTDLLVKARPEQTDFFAQSLRAKVQRSLVGAPGEPFRLGRFTVLGPLGGGGMGVVFVAYDPDLDRKIALKVLRNRGEPGRREVLREGRALARLKHANVVAVYEVGVIDDREFVAMEYVEGETLREWLREPRPAAAILARLVEAGRGLAAAHAVDLVHRDFKPENVVIDAAGHARVIDFGLARPLADLSGSLGEDPDARGTTSLHGGTPAYMAPERLGGAAGDHAADQYSYCVTCWEALFGVRPTDKRAGPAAPRSAPAWLRRVLERGLVPDPARRWPSMAALLAALERGARRVRLRRAALVVLAGLAVGAALEGLRRRDVARRVAACAASGADIDAVWTADARRRLREAFAATGVGFAEATVERVLPRLDAKAAAWRQARTEACLRADVEARWDADTAARAGFCLEDQQMDLAALVGEFARAEPNTLRHAVRAVDLLKPPASCLDEALLERQPSPPEGGHEATRAARAELSRARSLSLAGKFPAALEVVRAARVRIEAAPAWPPLWATARGMECASLEETGSYADAEAACMDAYFAGARAGAWSVAAHAATLLARAWPASTTAGCGRATPSWPSTTPASAAPRRRRAG
ncbi:MAG: serine/threonine protein kinase [Myxococcales bacterium]|nr:serine/threonine protein kinase [Myxococcales bacterium]